jgi:hypothetical protein
LHEARSQNGLGALAAPAFPNRQGEGLSEIELDFIVWPGTGDSAVAMAREGLGILAR